MRTSFDVAWLQLTHHKIKLAVASAGVVVAVMLMLVQLGIRQGALNGSVAIARRIQADLVVISPRTKSIFQSAPFPRRLLFRLPAHPAIAEVKELYIAQARFRNPWDHREYPLNIYGLDPKDPLLDLPGFSKQAVPLEEPDRVIFDSMSRSKFGPVTETLSREGPVVTEVNHRRVTIIDSIAVGVPISADGAIYTTPANFLRLFPTRSAGAVDIGLVRLKPGWNPETAIRELRPLLGKEATVLTQPELVDAEILFIRQTAPLDFIFGMGAAVGFFIGFVVVYQILYTEVTNHLPHFATMKAMGFTNGYLLRVVLSQAFILSILGYIPGAILAMGIYRVATAAIQMPITMTLSRAVMILVMTFVMCGLSAMIAVHKVRTADPADVF